MSTTSLEARKLALESLRKSREALTEQINAQAKDLFFDGAKELFAAHPMLESFGWTQYTPSWNDGDPTYFRANTEDFEMEMKDNSTDAQDSAANDAISDFLGEFEEDDLEEMFGDNQEITVTADGVDTDDYDCGY